MRGKFITFEGGEGSGKSTQLLKLAEILRQQGKTVLTTREPGGSPLAEKIRSLFVSHEEGEITDPLTEVLLVYAARRQHLQHTIRPALEKGTWVICDRFSDSTMAYQGYGRGVNKTFINKIYNQVVEDTNPDMTLIFDAPPKLCFKRLISRGQKDRIETMDMAFHRRLYKGFLAIAKKDPKRCRVIDATKSIEEVTKDILQHITSL